MLTLILLVVLGGVVGLLAVSLAESSKPATDEAPSRRADAERDLAPAASAVPVPAVTVAPQPVVAPVVEPRAAGPILAETLPRKVDRGSVPKAYTAVEGRYQDLIRPPIWRRMTSLALIVVIVVVVGVSIAGILGAIIGAVAEILGNTIG